MNNTRICNLALVSTTILLFILAILIFIKILFSGYSSFEWGSFSDLVSTAATVATFFVALLAYRKADDYIEKKASDKGVDILVNLVAESFVAYFHTLNETNFHAYRLNDKIQFFGMVQENIDCTSSLHSLKQSINTLFENSSQIDKDILKMKLLEISFPSSISFSSIQNFDNVEKIKNAYLTLEKEISDNTDQSNIDNVLLNENIDIIIDSTASIATNIRKQIFTSPNSYKDFLKKKEFDTPSL